MNAKKVPDEEALVAPRGVAVEEETRRTEPKVAWSSYVPRMSAFSISSRHMSAEGRLEIRANPGRMVIEGAAAMAAAGMGIAGRETTGRLALSRPKTSKATPDSLAVREQHRIWQSTFGLEISVENWANGSRD